MKAMRSLLLCVFLFFVIVSAYGLQAKEYSRNHDPSGRYTSVISYRRYQSWIPMPVGSSADKPGFVEIFDQTGSLGRLPVVMLQSANIQWYGDEVELVLIGGWNLKNRTCYLWSEDGMRKVPVTRPLHILTDFLGF